MQDGGALRTRTEKHCHSEISLNDCHEHLSAEDLIFPLPENLSPPDRKDTFSYNLAYYLNEQQLFNSFCFHYDIKQFFKNINLQCIKH